MIKGRDIIIVGIQPWDIQIGSNCKNIAVEFSKHNRVLYVNPPLDRITRLKSRKSERIQKRIAVSKGQISDLEQLDKNLWNLYPKTIIESINWMSSPTLFNFLNRRNSKLFASNIKSAVDRLGFKDYLIFNDSSMFLGLHLKELLQPELYTYYVRDNLIQVPYWAKHGERLEPKTIASADVVVNNSEYYVEYSERFNSNSHMVGQGCDVSMFNDLNNDIPIADEYNSIKSPVVGYVGSLTTLRLDIELLEYIAEQRPKWSIVLVGPEDEDFKRSKLHQLSNVLFLGNKPMNELPSYIKGFDVAINPQVINEITIGNYPRKIDEYLAMGKPIVATRTKAMEMFDDHVYLGESKEDYIALIELALIQHTKAKAETNIKFACTHTWTNSVKDIYKAMEITLNETTWN
ncbi:glycosyltransferase [Psychroserpens sp.]|uniref:glycosyltransferase n=1 Tax=Psychroserpens sp. TaxID=2020870 RepID=UPI001B14E8C6|nr:glycosyltransferase [Psychroserpens sp.]MBO6605715.1 glycosyltransferase [Psychroserpens sp.]MBO6630295.1 glycosyltransferase [Psychroserpens sp.]MBO6652914.1 glycosyltransferase [Psychroserpens sp.]MBO6681314.1 glycosyltransferase [Psychroserpens sp.]MBO6749089.1 glycosyltransferase [Psychroserpens sp.]